MRFSIVYYYHYFEGLGLNSSGALEPRMGNPRFHDCLFTMLHLGRGRIQISEFDLLMNFGHHADRMGRIAVLITGILAVRHSRAYYSLLRWVR